MTQPQHIDQGGMTIEGREGVLTRYIEEQGIKCLALRERDQPAFPWPSNDPDENPMFDYLIERFNELLKDTSKCESDEECSESLRAAIVWLVVHSWYEGSLAAIAKMNSTL